MLDGESVQVTLRTRFEAGTKELAWIVPVPSKPEFVKEGDELMFQVLEELTTPVFTRQVAQQRSGLGCGSGDNRDRGPACRVRDGRAGIFDYTVLRGTSVRGMRTVIRPETMDRDLDLEPSGPEDGDVSNFYLFHGQVPGSHVLDSVVGCAMLGALSLILRARHRTRSFERQRIPEQ